MAINSLSASSYGLSGLVSGMNTQEMVEKLLTGTQMKIDSTAQKKTTLEYKQQMYRDVMAKLTALQSSFLSFTSATNLLSNGFYNNMTTSIVPPTGITAAFSVTGSSSAKTGTVTMDYIKQLATARTARTGFDATGKVEGKLSQVSAQQLAADYSGASSNMIIRVGDKSVAITDAAAKFGGKDPAVVAEEINNAMARAGIEAEARYVNNKLQIKAADNDDFITISHQNPNNALATKMFGVPEVSGRGSLSASIDTDAYMPSFVVNLDGRQQNIHMDINLLRDYANASATDPADPSDPSGPTQLQAAEKALVDSLNDQMKRHFGSGVEASLNNGNIEFTSGGKSQKFTITGDLKAMNTLGLESGISNKLNTDMTLKDLNFGTQLQGNQHTFKINGVQFSYTADTSLSTVINDINKSKAGVKISYLESEDRFVIQNSETGAGSKDFLSSIEQSEGNLMSVLFGTKGSGVAQGAGITVDMVSERVNASSIQDGGTFTFNVNGKDVKVTISRDRNKQAPFTTRTFANEMNKKFADMFGKMPDGSQKVSFVESGGRFIIRANDNETVVKAVRRDSDTNTNTLGFTEGQTNLTTDGATTTLNQAGIRFGTGSGLSIKVGASTVTIDRSELSDSMTMDQLADLINAKIASTGEVGSDGNAPKVEFDDGTGAFRLMGVDIPMEIAVTGDSSASRNLDKLFGQSSIAIGQEFDLAGYNAANGTTLTAADILKETDAGQNAIFSIDGSEMERASNTFTVEGLTYTLNDITPTTTDPDTGVVTSTQAATKITVARDTEKIVEGITEYLKLYNETIDYINDLYKADATYKDYAPLTAKQKEEMSDREIELWEEKSKEGLLRNDPLLERVLSSLRTAMFTKPEGSSIALYDLGISTSFYANDGNFNAESIDDLRAAIEKDPEAVRQLFAGTGGIMELVNNAITNATKTSFASPGYLTQVAGSNVLDTSSSIYKQIKELDDQMGTLEDRYWNEYNRYWKQFNAMEQMIQQMNTQSSWLSQQFSQ